MKTKNKWGVVVGRPRMENWIGPGEPNLDYVGRWVIDLTFNTRKEARQSAKDHEAGNKSWHYHAKKKP